MTFLVEKVNTAGQMAINLSGNLRMDCRVERVCMRLKVETSLLATSRMGCPQGGVSGRLHYCSRSIIAKYNSGEFVYGEGKKKWDKYIGEFRNGMFHGNGTYYFSDGSRYKSSSIDDKRSSLFIQICWGIS